MIEHVGFIAWGSGVRAGGNSIEPRHVNILDGFLTVRVLNVCSYIFPRVPNSSSFQDSGSKAI